jgi:ACT domain-containing protein
MNKAIITVVGKDTVGILAKTCSCLAKNEINILDISQTIVGGYFNMMMVTDPTGSTVKAGQMADELTALGEGMGLSIRVMGEDIFHAMHRI